MTKTRVKKPKSDLMAQFLYFTIGPTLIAILEARSIWMPSGTPVEIIN